MDNGYSEGFNRPGHNPSVNTTHGRRICGWLQSALPQSIRQYDAWTTDMRMATVGLAIIHPSIRRMDDGYADGNSRPCHNPSVNTAHGRRICGWLQSVLPLSIRQYGSWTTDMRNGSRGFLISEAEHEAHPIYT